jgi:hypothetical protein
MLVVRLRVTDCFLNGHEGGAGSSGDLQELIAIPVQFKTGLLLLSLVAADVNLRGFDSR